MQCVKDKITSSNFKVLGTVAPADYYKEIGAARFVLSLPGLGYDCYRLWETLTVGSIPIIERAVGFDRNLYRLPALLVEDFGVVNENFLRQAYVEALYRVDEFEYSRLSQNHWEGILMKVSRAKSIKPLLEAHPMSAELENFARPFKQYDCKAMGGCGPGTKRTPDAAQSCPSLDWVEKRRRKQQKK